MSTRAKVGNQCLALMLSESGDQPYSELYSMYADFPGERVRTSLSQHVRQTCERKRRSLDVRIYP